MHFSSPSAYRLSWWRPWYRGWVGTRSNGYCSVTVGRNMFESVTPNPAMGATASAMPVRVSMSDLYALGAATSPAFGRGVTSFDGSATVHLLRDLRGLGLVGDRGGSGGRTLRARGRGKHLAGHGRDRVATRERVEHLGWSTCARTGLRLLLGDEERHEDAEEHHAGEPEQDRAQ